MRWKFTLNFCLGFFSRGDKPIFDSVFFTGSNNIFGWNLYFIIFLSRVFSLGGKPIFDSVFFTGNITIFRSFFLPSYAS